MISFSREVKEELLILEITKTKSVLSSIILAIGSIGFLEDEILLEIKSSNITLIRKIIKLLKPFKIEEKIIIRENKKFKNNNKLYILSIDNMAKDFLIQLELLNRSQQGIFLNLLIPTYIKKNAENIQEFLRYLFISSGSINNPKIQKQYHLEIICNNYDLLTFTQKITKKYNINFKITTRKNISALYLNKGEEIADFLKLIGCLKTMFAFEDQRLIRDIRASENRLINAEIANETKKNEAIMKQLDAIQKLKQHNLFNTLKERTKIIAIARLENKDLSLNELSQVLEGNISKSNIRYHLNLLIKEAEEL